MEFSNYDSNVCAASQCNVNIYQELKMCLLCIRISSHTSKGPDLGADLAFKTCSAEPGVHIKPLTELLPTSTAPASHPDHVEL